MATYNGVRFIREQIDSILPQLDAEDELIISDDGSTDGTLGILAEYDAADVRVKVLHHEKNPDYAKIRHSRNFYYATDNFENALRHAKGDYIFLADQDDVWAKDKISVMRNALDDFDYVLCNFKNIDEEGNVTKQIHFPKNPIKKSLLKNLLVPCFFGCYSAFSRKVLDTALPFPRCPCHDTWIGLVAVKHYRVKFLSSFYGGGHRYHDNQTTNSHSRSKVFALIYRLSLLIALLRRKRK